MDTSDKTYHGRFPDLSPVLLQPGSKGGDEEHEDGGEADDHVAEAGGHLLPLSLLGGFSSM